MFRVLGIYNFDFLLNKNWNTPILVPGKNHLVGFSNDPVAHTFFKNCVKGKCSCGKAHNGGE